MNELENELARARLARERQELVKKIRNGSVWVNKRTPSTLATVVRDDSLKVWLVHYTVPLRTVTAKREYTQHLGLFLKTYVLVREAQ